MTLGNDLSYWSSGANLLLLHPGGKMALNNGDSVFTVEDQPRPKAIREPQKGEERPQVVNNKNEKY